jgi:hypothetical protein
MRLSAVTLAMNVPSARRILILEASKDSHDSSAADVV